MKEFEFGTWYSIEELKVFTKRVLFAPTRDKDKIKIGLMTEYKEFENWVIDYEDDNGYTIVPPPKLWTPLPPRPEGEGEE